MAPSRLELAVTPGLAVVVGLWATSFFGIPADELLHPPAGASGAVAGLIKSSLLLSAPLAALIGAHVGGLVVPELGPRRPAVLGGLLMFAGGAAALLGTNGGYLLAVVWGQAFGASLALVALFAEGHRRDAGVPVSRLWVRFWSTRGVYPGC